MRFFVLVLVASVLFGFLAQPLITNRVPIEFDLGRYHLPLRDFYQKCLANGDDPHWCPHLFCGYDLHGEGQVGMDHPWHRLLYSCLPLTVAFNFEVFANYPFMCLGMYLFLRRHSLSRQAALTGALVFTFGGYSLPHYSHTNAIAIIAHIPWLLWLTDIFWNDPKRRAVAGVFIALFTGSQILLGYPQYVYFSCVAEGLYVMSLVLSASWTRSILWLTFKILGVLIGCSQLLPSLAALNRSPRLGYDKDFAGMLSLPPEMLLQLFSPTSFNVGTQLHEYTVYGGALATLATICFCLQRRTWTRLDYYALALIVVSVPLALGSFTPLFEIYKHMPIVGVFRGPCRYLVLGHFAAAILVALTVQRLARVESGSKSRCFVLLFVPAMAWILALTPWQQWVPESRLKFLAFGTSALIGAISLTISTLLLFYTCRGKRWTMPLLLVFGFSDLAYWGFRTIYGTHDQPVHTFVDLAAYLENQPTPPGLPNGRVALDAIHGNALLMKGWSLTSGYVGLSPPRQLDYSNGETLRLAGTTWQHADSRWQAGSGLPRVRWKQTASAEDIKIEVDRPGHVEIVTSAADSRTLVFAESQHPNWIATIDNQPVTILPVHGDFQSINVPTGEHRVVFRFDPVQRTLGRGIAACGLAATIALALWIGWRPKSTMSAMSG